MGKCAYCVLALFPVSALDRPQMSTDGGVTWTPIANPIALLAPAGASFLLRDSTGVVLPITAVTSIGGTWLCGLHVNKLRSTLP